MKKTQCLQQDDPNVQLIMFSGHEDEDLKIFVHYSGFDLVIRFKLFGVLGWYAEFLLEIEL